jgi:hypothetical protein
MKKVYVSLFGVDNFAWPKCLKQSVVLTVVDNDLLAFWTSADREGFITYSLKTKKTQRGNIPNRQTASRWYGLLSNIAETNGDYWLHRNGDELWWTISTGQNYSLIVDETDASAVDMTFIQKPSMAWSNKDRNGAPLRWSALHPRARNILSTQSTQISLSDENRDYVLSLIQGNNLEAWHSLPDWKESASKGGNAGIVFNARQRTIWRIVASVKGTVAQANGQLVERIQKNKELRMSEEALAKLVDDLLDQQENLCAVSGIPLQFDGEETDKQLLCSLDRIDSLGHYEEGNLQLVCRFINKWKSSDSDAEVRRLLGVVRSASLL